MTLRRAAPEMRRTRARLGAARTQRGAGPDTHMRLDTVGSAIHSSPKPLAYPRRIHKAMNTCATPAKQHVNPIPTRGATTQLELDA